MNDKPKKQYLRPEVTQVPLRPDEAVLGACKSASVAGPVAAACTQFHCQGNAS